MPVVTKMLESMGPADHTARIHKLMTEGKTHDEAAVTALLEFASENNRMLRALLLMHGRSVSESSHAEAVHNMR